MYVSIHFKIMSKVVNYTCRLRRYNYTHNQLSARHFSIIFRNFFEGGGAQNLSLPLGASYPRYATETSLANGQCLLGSGCDICLFNISIFQ